MLDSRYKGWAKGYKYRFHDFLADEEVHKSVRRFAHVLRKYKSGEALRKAVFQKTRALFYEKTDYDPNSKYDRYFTDGDDGEGHYKFMEMIDEQIANVVNPVKESKLFESVFKYATS